MIRIYHYECYNLLCQSEKERIEGDVQLSENDRVVNASFTETIFGCWRFDQTSIGANAD